MRNDPIVPHECPSFGNSCGTDHAAGPAGPFNEWRWGRVELPVQGH